MYVIIPTKRKTRLAEHDYIFKDFKSFYDFASSVTVPLTGRYSIGIKADKMNEIQDFIKRQDEFTQLMVSLYVSETVVDYMTLYNSNLPVRGAVSDYDIFKSLVQERNLYFAKGVLDTLYLSIEHTRDIMVEVLDKVAYEFKGTTNPITESMLAPYFILTKVTYPRSVLVSYIQMDRWRSSKMKKCLEDVGNDVMLGAFIKNLKSFMEMKVTYYKTGKGTKFIKSLNTNNLGIMYRVFVVERNGIKDATLLLSLYERGLSPNDFIQERIG